jgi:hypothetical protein
VVPGIHRLYTSFDRFGLDTDPEKGFLDFPLTTFNRCSGILLLSLYMGSTNGTSRIPSWILYCFALYFIGYPLYFIQKKEK